MILEKEIVVVFTFNFKDYFIGKLSEPTDTDEDLEWTLSEMAMIVPTGDGFGFSPVGIVLSSPQGLGIFPLVEEFRDSDIRTEIPKMWTIVNDKTKEQFEQYLVSLSAKRAGIVAAKEMPKNIKLIKSTRE